MSRLARLLPALMLVAAACDDATAPAAPEPLPALQDQVWHVHVSDGQPVPALLGHRMLPGNILEQDFLDSARIEIDADGTWEHKGWYQRFRSMTYQSSIATLDWGTWTATPTGYEFRRNTGELLYTVNGPIGNELQLNLRYPNQEGLAVSTLRRTPAPLSVAGRWRAISLDGVPLPATYTSDPEIDAGAGVVSRHILIDSAVVILRPNNRYEQLVYYSEWEGPANGAPQSRVYAEIATDFGTWDRTGTGGLFLSSGWLQNKTMAGEPLDAANTSLRLSHGITHSDPPVAFRYARW